MYNYNLYTYTLTTIIFSAKLYTIYYLFFRYFRSGTDDSRESVLVKQVGNVTADTEITYEYGIKSKTLQPSSPKTTPKATPKTSSDEDEDKVKSKGTWKYMYMYTEIHVHGIHVHGRTCTERDSLYTYGCNQFGTCPIGL